MGYFRRPQTTQERRLAYDDWEGLLQPRSKRNARNLVDSYDDIPRHPYERKSWKYYRDHQYRVKSDKPKKDSSRYGKSMSRRDHFHNEHRYCRYPRSRCEWCWKNDAWDDAAIRRDLERRRKQSAELRKRWKWWTDCESERTHYAELTPENDFVRCHHNDTIREVKDWRTCYKKNEYAAAKAGYRGCMACAKTERNEVWYRYCTPQ